ncbi:MAG: ATPase [Lutibacter sp.]|nr:ATPase [Lutibacter sp.]
METPFVFGRIATEKNFTNRTIEIERLVNNFNSFVNTILISPRRWGKSSLVAKASKIAMKNDETLRFCFIDLYNIRSEEDFYQTLAKEVLKNSSSKMEEISDNVKKFLGQFLPRISFSPGSDFDFSLGLNWKEIKMEPDEIINLPEKIAHEKNLRFVICIDEFQNISEFEEPLAFQKKMRSLWQVHQKTSYCLYGSKRHMLLDVFTSSSMPFYKFGDVVFLEKIDSTDWLEFIKTRFEETGKTIDDESINLITSLTDCHPYYVQQLAQQTWFRTKRKCSKELVFDAFENLVMQLSLLFQTLTDELSKTQINFLKAILKNAIQLSSKSTIKEYQLGSSANVLKIKNALIKKEIIDIQIGEISFMDPLYKYWLKKYYFKIYDRE